MQVRDLPSDEFETVHAFFQTWFGPTTQCSASHFWPALVDMRNADRAFVAESRGRPRGVMLAKNDGTILWCFIDDAWVDEAFPALAEHVFTECGQCWGIVFNEELRERYLDASGAHARQDEDRPAKIWWAA